MKTTEVSNVLREEWNLQVREQPDKQCWWMYSKGHIWQSNFISLVRKDSQCPYCNGNSAIKGYNDVATLYPQPVEKVFPTKNGDRNFGKNKISSEKKA